MVPRRTVVVLGVLTLAALALQLFQPEAPRPRLPDEGPMTDHISVPPDVERLLRRACYDCHSAETQWPWYSRVAPVSWLLVGDVRQGRADLDFSHWSMDPVAEPTPAQRLTWTCREVREDNMPPRLYRLAHPEARLSGEEQERICAWSRRALHGLRPTTTRAR